MVSKIIKKGIKAVVKRGRKSKRGRPKKKVETPVVTKKKQDPFKIKKQKGESAEAFKKRKAAINKLRKQQEKEMAKEMGTKKPSEKGRTEKSMIKPPLKKEMSKARRRRLVMQRLMGTNPKTGESKDIGRMGFPISETMRDLGYTGSRKGGLDLTEEQLRNMGFQIKRAGGALKDIPAGNKGLPNLPTTVRNNMGFKKMGGVIKAQSGTGKNPILSKKERSKEGMKPKPGTKGGAIGKRKYKGPTRKPLDAFRKPLIKRAGGGIALRGFGATRKK